MKRIHGQTHRTRGIALATMLLVAAPTLAHIKNEATQFPDIEFSDARFDIVVLVGAGIVPETPVFEPDKNLSRAELASWAGLAGGLGRGGENPDTNALAEAALEAGLVTSLEGDATWTDVNGALFEGQLTLDEADAVPTKAAAATFVAEQLETDFGLALLEPRGLSLGATGQVTAIESQSGQGRSGYVITVGDSSLPMDVHGRVANGPTDLLQWEGLTVVRSFVTGSDANASWFYLEAGVPEPETTPEPAAGTTEPAAATALPATAAPVAEEPPPPDRTLLGWLVAAALLLAVVLFFSRRRAS